MQPKVIVSANCGVEPGRIVEYKPLLDNAIELSGHKPPTVIIYNREYEAVSRDQICNIVILPVSPHRLRHLNEMLNESKFQNSPHNWSSFFTGQNHMLYAHAVTL